jgi:hypothetical protein
MTKPKTDAGTPLPERWAWVTGHEGLYRVSNRGDVWSTPRPQTRGGFLRQAVTKANGYHWVSPSKDGEQRPREVHKIVMEAFVGPCPEGLEVRHLDGNPGNNCWAPGSEEETVAAGGNLIYGTHTENIRDKKRHGTEWQSNVTQCPKGHDYTPENTRIFKSGSRACKACARIQSREWMRAHATRKDPMMTCPYCEQPFERPFGQGRRQFCSEECYRAHRARRRREASAAP